MAHAPEYPSTPPGGEPPQRPGRPDLKVVSPIEEQLNDGGVINFDAHPRRALKKKKHHITIGGVIRTALVATALAGGAYGAINAPRVINWSNQQLTDNNSDNGKWDLPAPSGRQLETINPSAKSEIITPDQLPHLNPVPFSEILLVPGFKSKVGLDAYPDGDPSAEVDPVAAVSGYLVGKEKQPDGSYLFAMEVPYVDGTVFDGSALSTAPVCTETSGPQGFDLKNNIREEVAGGFILWLNVLPATDTSWYPLETQVEYGNHEFAAIGGGHVGLGPNVLYEYAKIGDPIRAKINLGMNFASPDMQKALQHLVDTGHAKDLEDARTQIQKVLSGNMDTLNRLKADSGTTITLQEQLEGKRYVVTPITTAFLPQVA